MKSWRNTRESYGLVAIFLHWTVALLVLALIVVGLSMTRMEDSENKWWLYSLHKSLGFSVAALLLLRLLWRWTQALPQPLKGLKQWEILAAHWAHLGLYTLLLVLPLSGYLDSVAGGYKTQFFGLNMPLWVAKDKALAKFALLVHWSASYILYLLLALHIGAVLKHHVAGNAVLKRMSL